MTKPSNPKHLDSQPIAAAVGPMPAADPGVEPDQPMTDRQAVELRDLAEKTGEQFDGGLTEAQAAEGIAYLREKA